MEYVLKHSQRTFIIGSNFGPYIDPDFYSMYADIFSRIDGICFRDKYSYNLFSLPNAHFAPDIVLNYKTARVIDNQNYYVISVINLKERSNIHQYTDIYEKKIKEMAVQIIQNGFRVVFMSFCERQGDLKAIHRISDSLEEYKQNIVVYSHKKLDESLEIIAHANGIIATRFHAMILAFLFNKPVLPISYSDKMTNAMIDYGYEHTYICIHDIHKLDTKKTFQYLLNTPNIQESIFDQAERQFSDIDKIIDR